MHTSDLKLTILYGSQTGNAQDVSERIWRESKRYYFKGTIKNMDEYNITDLIHERCVIFICSTTGQGEEPDNMKSFWKFLLKKHLPSNSLNNVKCAVLGLGDSGYIKFNFVAKRLHKRIMQLGGQMILPLALGDDQHDLGYDAVVDPWINSLWDKLLEIYPLPQNVVPKSENTIIEPRWKMDISSANPSNINTKIGFPEPQFLMTVKENTRTTSNEHFQDVRLIKFSANSVKYSPGDVLYVRPKNSENQIQEFYDIFKSNEVQINLDASIKLSNSDQDMSIPKFLENEVHFGTLCREYFDLNAIPRRYIFSVLAQITTSDLEREKCLEFSSAEGQNDLYNYCNRPRRNIVEVLQDFPHAVKNLTLEIMFEIFTPIKPRAFSIASSFSAHVNEIHILVAVVKYKTKLLKPRLGLCSNWLSELKLGDTIDGWVKKGSFKFPYEKEVPVIMVGPGTGVAPFRNYILEIEKLGISDSKNIVLFFGCRKKDMDFHCENDFSRLKNENKLTLICAFSRDQENKEYVQHKIEENAENIWKMMKTPNLHIFIAGNSKNMPQEVRETFVQIWANHEKVSKENAENFVEKLEKIGRYQTETWS